MHEVAVIEPAEDSEQDTYDLNCTKIYACTFDPYVIDCSLNDQKIFFEVDTGSGTSTLRYDDFKKLNCPLQGSKVKLLGYNQIPIKVFGKVSKVVYKDQICSDIDLIVGSDSPNNLMGRNLISKFDIVNINHLNVKEFYFEYTVDSSKPIKGYQAKLFPKPNHAPVFQKPRTVALKLRD